MHAERALDCLIDSLACGLQALDHPACARLIGPVVAGATMAGGARVPGTSYDLDPVQAAFSIGTMIHWLDLNDALLASHWGHPADSLGGILTIADHLSRKAIAQGRPSLRVSDVLVAMVDAYAIQRMVAHRFESEPGPCDRMGGARLATAAVVTSMLGGGREQVLNAVSYARSETGFPPPAGNEGNGHRRGPRGPWLMGDATGRGVRLALLAMTVECQPAAAVPAIESNSLTHPDNPTELAILQRLFARDAAPAITSDSDPSGTDRRVTARFEACVSTRYAPVQANKIKALLDDRPRLMATPVHEFMAILVRN